MFCFAIKGSAFIAKDLELTYTYNNVTSSALDNFPVTLIDVLTLDDAGDFPGSVDISDTDYTDINVSYTIGANDEANYSNIVLKLIIRDGGSGGELLYDGADSGNTENDVLEVLGVISPAAFDTTDVWIEVSIQCTV